MRGSDYQSLPRLKGDHAKYAKEFVKAGIDVYSTPSLSCTTCGRIIPMVKEKVFQIGNFSVTPLEVQHDVECYAYLIHHPEYGSIYFFTDAYNMKQAIRGCKCYMCECNYDDSLLERAVNEGKTIASQADRIRLSHMSLAHGIQLLQQCEVEKSAHQIVLIHGSSRHLNPEKAVSKFQQVLGVPTYYARPHLEINLM